MPDALDDLRDLLKTLHRAATPGECIQAHRILAALEAERRENAELLAAIKNEAERYARERSCTYHCEDHAHNILYLLSEADHSLDDNTAEARALLNGGAK